MLTLHKIVKYLTM